MTATSHALIGASIAYRLPNPWVGLPLALLSHFLADIIPHWDVGNRRRLKSRRRLFIEAGMDVLLGLVLVWSVFNHRSVNSLYLIAAIFIAQLPDWIDSFLPLALNYHGFPVRLVERVQHLFQWRLDLPWGLITQTVLVTAILYTFGLFPHPAFHLLAY